MDRKVFMAILLVLAVAALLYLTVAIFRPFLVAVLWAAVIATVTYRPYERLTARWRGRRQLASLCMVLLVLIVLVVPLLYITVVLSQQAGEVVALFQKAEAETGKEEEGEPKDEKPAGEEAAPTEFSKTLERVEENWLVQDLLRLAQKLTGSEEPLKLVQVLQAVGKPVLGWATRAVPEAIGGAALYALGFLANVFFILLALFYFYRDGPDLVRVFRELIPMREEYRNEILGEIRAAIVASVQGGLLTALIQGFLGFVILLILGFHSPVFWGFVMALASLVPLVGTALIWVPMAGFLFIQGEVVSCVVLVGYGVLVVGMSDNVLRPILVGRHLQVHPLLLFFGILGGIAAFGLLGIVLGPVAVAFLVASSRLLRREFSAADAQAPA